MPGTATLLREKQSQSRMISWSVEIWLLLLDSNWCGWFLPVINWIRHKPEKCQMINHPYIFLQPIWAQMSRRPETSDKKHRWIVTFAVEQNPKHVSLPPVWCCTSFPTDVLAAASVPVALQGIQLTRTFSLHLLKGEGRADKPGHKNVKRRVSFWL